ncbi:hypothetical protein [Metasolibacillus meyeri]|uniref:hypothetical protein n=1 Tax=Metasolibacillus meyeri TaxID=1071052 RepID=UPI000D302ECE|nr:hypothetical protein [Metasolibacillus meyeri]
MSKILKLNNYQYTYNTEKLNIFSELHEYSISGESTKDIFSVLQLCNSRLSQEEIYTNLELPKDYFQEIMNFLKNKEIVKFDKADKSEAFKMLSSMKPTLTPSEIEEELKFLKKRKIGILGDSSLVNFVNDEIKEYFDTVIIGEDEILNEDTLYIVVYGYEDIDKFLFFNDKAHNRNVTFLRSVVTKDSLSLGPIYIPKETVCYSCFLNRVLSNKSEPSIYLKYYKSGKLSAKTEEYPQDVITMGTVSIKKQLIKYCSNYFSSELVHKEIVHHFYKDEIHFNKILMIPNCVYCD